MELSCSPTVNTLQSEYLKKKLQVVASGAVESSFFELVFMLQKSGVRVWSGEYVGPFIVIIITSVSLIRKQKEKKDVNQDGKQVGKK